MSPFKKIWTILSMKCDQASLLASDSLDRRLKWHERLGLKCHVMVCFSCRHFRKQLKMMRGAFQNFSVKDEGSPQPVTVKLSESAKMEIKSQLDSKPE